MQLVNNWQDHPSLSAIQYIKTIYLELNPTAAHIELFGVQKIHETSYAELSRRL